jgi:hypothetical protein
MNYSPTSATRSMGRLEMIENEALPLLVSYITTRNSCFAKCLKHSTKPKKHSANALLSLTLGKESSANCTSAMTSLLSTFYRALDKVFAKCQKVLDKEKSP